MKIEGSSKLRKGLALCGIAGLMFCYGVCGVINTYAEEVENNEYVTEESQKKDNTQENIDKANKALNGDKSESDTNSAIKGSDKKLETKTNKNDDSGMADYIKNNGSIDQESVKKGQEGAGFIKSIIGYLTGVVTAITAACIFLITALDLMYIAIPPVRGFLYAGNQQGAGMMGGGYGAQGGVMGSAKPKQWVSDEVLSITGAVEGAGGGMMQQSMGGYGGMMQQMGQGQPKKRSMIATYFVKRAVFMVIFVIATVVLLSSIFLGTGLNLADWFMNLIVSANEHIPH